MKRRNSIIKFIILAAALALAFALAACGGSAGPAPEVSGLTLTAAEGEALGETESKHILGYSATEGSTVTVAVAKNGLAAADGDYTYTESEKSIVFHSAGKFTVTVVAEKNGLTDAGTVTADIVSSATVRIKDFAVSAKEGQIYGKIGQTHLLAYTVTPEETSASVKVEKRNGEQWNEVTGAYSTDTKELTFADAGVYKVTVSAESVSESVEVTVSRFSANITGGFGNVTGYGRIGVEHSLTYSVTCESGYAGTPSVSVEFYKENGSGAYTLASGVDYTYNSTNGKVTFSAAGQYKAVISTTQAEVETVSREVPITVSALAKPLITLTADNMRVQEGNAVTLSASAVYDVPDEKESESLTVLYSDGTGYVNDTTKYSLSEDKTTLTPSSPGFYMVRFVAEGTCDTSAEKFIEIEVGADLGQTPFADTYDTLIPSTGLMLYHDVEYGGVKLPSSKIAYEVTEVNLTKRDGSALAKSDVVVESLLGNIERRYLLVKNFEDNTATGTVTVQITAIINGARSTATKVFTVTPLAKDKPSNANDGNVEGFNAYVAAVMGAEKAANYDKIMTFGYRQNAVVAKDGVIFHRSNGSWPYNSDNMFCVEPNGANDFQVDFTYTIYGRHNEAGGNKEPNKASFCVNMRTGSYNGWCGNQIAFYSAGTATDITTGCWVGGKQNNVGNTSDSSANPSAVIGKTYYFRLTHTLSSGTVTYDLKWSEDGTTYNDWFSFGISSSDSAGNMGAPVYAIQFIRESGCLKFGDVTLTTL